MTTSSPTYVQSRPAIKSRAAHVRRGAHAATVVTTATGGLVRWPIIGSLITAGVAHVPITAQHLTEAPYMGVMFVMFTATALLMTGALALGPSPLRFALATGLCAAAICAYIASRLVAFPMLSDDLGAWTEPLGILAVSAEAAVVMQAVNSSALTGNTTRDGRASDQANG